MPSVVSPPVLGAAALLVGLGLALSAETHSLGHTLRGGAEKIGAGTVQSFVTLDQSGATRTIGVTVSAGALEQLPPVPNTVSRCFDLDGNGKHTGHECLGDEERILDVPVDSSAGLPFRWIQVNWNPAGQHNTPYAQPHFDFHFHTGDRARVEAGYIDIRAAIFWMASIAAWAFVIVMVAIFRGSQSPELKDSLPFTTTFMYGAYDGEVILREPMITRISSSTPRTHVSRSASLTLSGARDTIHPSIA
jgi:hypothetical protein